MKRWEKRRFPQVVISAGPVYLEPSLADAVLYAGYPGMEAGHGEDLFCTPEWLKESAFADLVPKAASVSN
jgi:hypothetical protein